MLGLIAAAALFVAGDPPVAGDATQTPYQAAQASAGRSADDQVRLAYWCEAHGLTAERLRHLALAVLADPNHATARGLLGLVARQDRWLRPAAVASQVRADSALAATLAEYDRKRSATPYTADDQWALGQWADEQGLKEQARAHFTAVIRLDPKRDVAWKRLGYARHDGKWATDAEVATARADADAQKAADRKWTTFLKQARADLDNPSRRGDAETRLAAVTDPRAVPGITRAFVTDQIGDQRVAVRLLGQVDSARASRTLALLAVLSTNADIRRAAMETLRHRDPREFADLLFGRLQKPIHFEVRPVGGPGSPGVLFVEGQKANKQRVYTPASVGYVPQANDQFATDANGLPVLTRQSTQFALTGRITGNVLESYLGSGKLVDPTAPSPLASVLPQLSSLPAGQAGGVEFAQRLQQAQQNVRPGALQTAINNVARNEHKSADQFGFSVSGRETTTTQIPIGEMMLQAQQSAIVAQRQLASDVQQLETWNQQVRQSNDEIEQVLTSVSGKNFGDDAQAWKNWWVDQLGYTSFNQSQESTRPTIVEDVPINYQPAALPVTVSSQFVMTGFRRMSCFAAGTVVETISGPQPIETLKVGDMVLTQSTSSGALGYHPILVTHHNPPAPTFRIKLDTDTVVASQFHRFWVARRGWVMARDLKAGDPVRTLGGVVPVAAVEAGKIELVYNLDVADEANFFAGSAAALVHDNSLPDPRLVPFDLAPTNSIKSGER